jgi:hypothetical protein
MNSLLNLFKKAPKGDGLRAVELPETYNDGIAKLNALGSDQYRKITTQRMNQINKNKLTVTQTNQSANSTAPGLR